MKLLYCNACNDVFNLHYEVKSCRCGGVKGKYLPDGLNAVYSGEEATPLGFANQSFQHAVVWQPEEGLGKRFDAFVIPEECPTFLKVGEEVVESRISLIES